MIHVSAHIQVGRTPPFELSEEHMCIHDMPTATRSPMLSRSMLSRSSSLEWASVASEPTTLQRSSVRSAAVRCGRGSGRRDESK